MELEMNSLDFRNINANKGRKVINILSSLSDEEIIKVLNSDVIETIALCNANIINIIFRKANATAQTLMWENDKIKRALIYGTKNISKVKYDGTEIRNLENLNKVIKSDTIKNNIYNSDYFVLVIINTKILKTNRFFKIYDVKKVFNGVISSNYFNSLDSSEQLKIIEKINDHSEELLLPNNFRSRYNNISKILYAKQLCRIDDNIYNQLNDEELLIILFLYNKDINYSILNRVIYKSVFIKKRTFKDMFRILEEKEKLIRKKKYGEYYYLHGSISDEKYSTYIDNIEDENEKEVFLNQLTDELLDDSTIDRNILYNTLKRNLNNGLLNLLDIKYLISSNDLYRDLNIMFYIKFNIALNHVNYLSGISPDQMYKLNLKHVNKLIKLAEDKTQDEISYKYGFCIKMYLLFGYERSVDILNGRFGKFNRVFVENVLKIDVSRIQMIEDGKKYLPSLDMRFINFMFETPKSNHFINMLKDKNSDLYRRWYYLFNNYDDILEKCHDEITLRKVNQILEVEKIDINRNIIEPDCYRLNNNSFLEDITLGNKTRHSNDDVLRKIVEIYSKMKKRVESSIPYVEGKSSNGYGYQTMKFDDINAFTLGYKASCCIRTYDIAHNHLLHATLCRNGRILLLYDNIDDLVAFCPLKRNGNVLIVNSIECINKSIDIRSTIADTFLAAILDMVNVSKQSSEPIELVCIGRSAYCKPRTVPFPAGYRTPTIYEKNDEVYSKTDEYHRHLDIVYMEDGFNLNNIKNEDPHVSYMDPREEVRVYDYTLNKDDYYAAMKAINSINYTINHSCSMLNNGSMIKRVYYTKDWYIYESYFGIYSECLDNDYRAREEYEYYLELINNKNKQMTLRMK